MSLNDACLFIDRLCLNEWRNHLCYILVAIYIKEQADWAASSTVMEAMGLYDFSGTDDDELSFKKGQIVKVWIWTCHSSTVVVVIVPSSIHMYDY